MAAGEAILGGRAHLCGKEAFLSVQQTFPEHLLVLDGHGRTRTGELSGSPLSGESRKSTRSGAPWRRGPCKRPKQPTCASLSISKLPGNKSWCLWFKSFRQVTSFRGRQLLKSRVVLEGALKAVVRSMASGVRFQRGKSCCTLSLSGLIYKMSILVIQKGFCKG